MAATATLMTVAEFEREFDLDERRLELRGGEVFDLGAPKKNHIDTVSEINWLLSPVARPAGRLKEEFAFYPLSEHERRIADLAWVPWARWASLDPDDTLVGAPDFVVEVVSPSNKALEMREKKDLCMENGCREFWLVYPRSRVIEVTTASGIREYRSGQSVPLTVFPGHSVEVDRIFGRV